MALWSIKFVPMNRWCDDSSAGNNRLNGYYYGVIVMAIIRKYRLNPIEIGGDWKTKRWPKPPNKIMSRDFCIDHANHDIYPVNCDSTAIRNVYINMVLQFSDFNWFILFDLGPFVGFVAFGIIGKLPLCPFQCGPHFHFAQIFRPNVISIHVYRMSAAYNAKRSRNLIGQIE